MDTIATNVQLQRVATQAKIVENGGPRGNHPLGGGVPILKGTVCLTEAR